MSHFPHLEFLPQAVLSKYDTDSKIKQYFTLLMAENKKMNLVSRETSSMDLERLAAESILPFEVIASRSFDRYLDIGSGGGFPAFPIIMSAKIGQATLIERTRKKAAVLKRLAEELNLKAKVIDTNFEECRFSEKFDLVTLRLVKLTRPLIKRIFLLLKPGGIFIYYSQFKNSPGNKTESSSYSYATGQDRLAKSFTVFIKN